MQCAQRHQHDPTSSPSHITSPHMTISLCAVVNCTSTLTCTPTLNSLPQSVQEREERERDNMNISKMTSPIPGLFGSSTVLAVTPRSNEINTQSYSHTTTRVVDHNAIGEKNSETWKNEVQ